MKHFSADKYNLAWFKLAECVSRGEKERALGVYRLLSHSVGNDALSSQLYADILLSFDDKVGAIEKYLEAVELYKKENKFIEAIAIYEHLLFLHSNCQEHVIELCNLYLKINLQFKVIEHLDKLINSNKINSKNFEYFADILQKLESCVLAHEYVKLNQNILFILLLDKNTPRELVINYLEKIINYFTSGEPDIDNNLDNGLILNDFLNKLKVQDEDYYNYVLRYLE